jgi:hypothetical protein
MHGGERFAVVKRETLGSGVNVGNVSDQVQHVTTHLIFLKRIIFHGPPWTYYIAVLFAKL